MIEQNKHIEFTKQRKLMSMITELQREIIRNVYNRDSLNIIDEIIKDLKTEIIEYYKIK